MLFCYTRRTHGLVGDNITVEFKIMKHFINLNIYSCTNNGRNAFCILSSDDDVSGRILCNPFKMPTGSVVELYTAIGGGRGHIKYQMEIPIRREPVGNG